MALAKIKYLQLIAPKEHHQTILTLLQKLGVVQIEALEQGVNMAPGGQEAPWEELLGKVKYCLGYLTDFQEKSGSFLDQLASTKKPIRMADFRLDEAAKRKVFEVYEKTREIEAKLPELGRKLEELGKRQSQLEPWQSFNFRLKDLGPGQYVHLLAAEVPAKNWQQLEESMSAELSPFALTKGQEKKTIPFLLAVKKEELALAEELFAEAEAKIVTFPPGEGTVQEELIRVKQEIKALQAQREELLVQAKKLAQANMALLELVHDYASSELDRFRAAEQLGATDETFALEGWIKAQDVEKLKAELAELDFPLYFAVREPREDEEVPVALENSPLARPFESVLEMYSPPKPGELDPTPWVGPFFSLFFGIMLTDAGYGIIMALAALFLLKKVKMEEAGQKLLLILFWGGIGAGLAGALAGGWFGDLFGLPPLWFNPMEEPLKMMVVSFALGLVHIFVGMGLEFYDNVRQGDVWSAIFDQGFWFALILGLVFLFLPPLASIGGWLAKIGAVGLVLTQGRHQKNILMKLGSGLASLYNLSGILGDVLSYSRLLALGLATGVIANVINMLAKMALDFPYGLGYIVMVVILVGGHLFNLFIGAMGSYVHTSRLQYIEFFGKFFEGGGKLFSPFKIQQKYTYFQDEVKEDV